MRAIKSSGKSRLTDDRQGYPNIQIDINADSALQIRNIFQTAVSLALYEAKTDKKLKGRPTLRSEHLKKVVTLSCEFQDYLRSTRESDSDKAKDGELRDDNFKRAKSKKRSDDEED